MTALDIENRPAVARVASLPASYGLKPAERLVLLALACDSYDGETSAPGMDALAEWTGLFRGAAYDVVKALSEPTDRRPALIERSSTRGRNRTVFRLILEPSDNPGRLPPGEPAPARTQPSGEPSDNPGRLRANQPVDKSPQPSGQPSGEPSGQPSGQPSGNPGLHPSLPFPSNPPTPHEPATVRDASPWFEEECDASPQRGDDRRGPHVLDEAGVRCQHCNVPRPDLTEAERRERLGRRKLGTLHRDRRLGGYSLDKLTAQAARLGRGDLYTGALELDALTRDSLGDRPARVLEWRINDRAQALGLSAAPADAHSALATASGSAA